MLDGAGRGQAVMMGGMGTSAGAGDALAAQLDEDNVPDHAPAFS